LALCSVASMFVGIVATLVGFGPLRIVVSGDEDDARHGGEVDNDDDTERRLRQPYSMEVESAVLTAVVLVCQVCNA